MDSSVKLRALVARTVRKLKTDHRTADIPKCILKTVVWALYDTLPRVFAADKPTNAMLEDALEIKVGDIITRHWRENQDGSMQGSFPRVVEDTNDYTGQQITEE